MRGKSTLLMKKLALKQIAITSRSSSVHQELLAVAPN